SVLDGPCCGAGRVWRQRTRRADTDYREVGQWARWRRRKAVDADAEAVEHEVDPMGDRHGRASREQQPDWIEIRVVGDDERAGVPAAAERAGRNDQLIDEARGLGAADSRDLITHGDRSIDAGDLAVREPRGAAVF